MTVVADDSTMRAGSSPRPRVTGSVVRSRARAMESESTRDGDAIESIVVGARRRGAFERAHADAVPYGEER